MTRRVISVWLPTWPTDRIRRRDGSPSTAEPLVVAERQGAKRVVTAVDARARALGLRPGMAVATAQATTPGLAIAEADVAGDEAALHRLAAWCLRYAPLVAADAPDGLVLDVAGAAHLHGGETALAGDLAGRLERGGITARWAVAGSWAAAWALARYAPGTVLSGSANLDDVASLPVPALRLSPDVSAGLRALGFETVADVAAAPRASLILRFGPGLAERLDMLTGIRPELFEPVLSPEIPHVRLAFAEPLGHLRGLELALGRLAGLLCAELERRGLGLRRADLRLHRVDGQVAALRAMAALATRDAAHLVRLFGERLATVDPGFGVEAAVLAATLTEPFAAAQARVRLDGDEAEDAVADLAMLVDRLGARIGTGRVYRLAVVESDMPERGLVLVPVLAAGAGRSWSADPRPSRLFAPPEPVEVVALLPDHPPAVLMWRGRRHRITAADGPECVAGEWWLSDDEVALVRDYYRVEDADGHRLWLFRARTTASARWFVHGVFA